MIKAMNVLIVAKCIVNVSEPPCPIIIQIVLIVAKCIVNKEETRKIFFSKKY